ncbi:MAG: chemotaxis protein CheX [Deltaproteobacteria bacterium]|nr:chemotaxis protein CheX [Deltaproteobacteria bacterium]
MSAPSLLQRITTQTLEEVAFVFAFPSSDLPCWREALITASLDYAVDGGPTGTLRLACPPSLGALVAANLLGLDEDEEAALAAAPDAVGELLNILMGVYAEERFGSAVACSFTPPTVTTTCARDCELLRASAVDHAVLVTEEGDDIELLVSEG